MAETLLQDVLLISFTAYRFILTPFFYQTPHSKLTTSPGAEEPHPRAGGAYSRAPGGWVGGAGRGETAAQWHGPMRYESPAWQGGPMPDVDLSEVGKWFLSK